MWELPHPEVIDDQQRHGRGGRRDTFWRAIERGIGDLVDQRIGFAIDDTVALLGGAAAQRLREMAFAGPGRPEKQGVFARADEARRGELVDQRQIRRLVKVEINAANERSASRKPACL